MSGPKLDTLEHYLKKVDKMNYERENEDIRVKFFHNPKLKKILLLKKVNTCSSLPISRTLIHEIITPDNKMIDEISRPELRKYVLSNLDSLLYNPIEIAEMHDSNYRKSYPDCNYLEYIKVNKENRNSGLAHQLISTLKSSSINNGDTLIRGQVLPLDPKAYFYYANHKTPPLYQQIINHFARKNDKYAKYAFTDIQHLFEIYRHLGFEVDEESRFFQMKVDKNSIPKEERLPKSFTNFDKNPETLILF